MTRTRLGREALLDAAAILMDERGIDSVSLNEINRTSGHRNRSAVTYHFGSKDTVVRELVARTMTILDAERNALLDHLEIAGPAPLTDRAVVEVVVGPLARQLRTPDGRRYLRLCAQLITHPRFVNDPREALLMSTSAQRCAQHLAGAVAHLPPAISVERASQMIGFLIRACGDQARLLDAEEPSRAPLGIEAFSANLVDTMLAILHAPTTARLNGQG